MPKLSVEKLVPWKKLEDATQPVKEILTQTENDVRAELHKTSSPFCRWFITDAGMRIVGEGFTE